MLVAVPFVFVFKVATSSPFFVLAVPSLVSQIIPGSDFINAVYLIGGAGI